VSDFSTAPGAPAPSKVSLRREALALRRARDGATARELDEQIRATVVTWLTGRSARSVAAYAPMIGEPGGLGLPEALAGAVERILLPVLLPDHDLDWAEYRGRDDLRPGALGLAEPSGPRLGPGAIASVDVILVPALTVDRAGNRLGRGGGSFDRALARTAPPQISLALLYPGELRDELPAEAHDRPVRGVVVGGHVTMLSTGHGPR